MMMMRMVTICFFIFTCCLLLLWCFIVECTKKNNKDVISLVAYNSVNNNDNDNYDSHSYYDKTNTNYLPKIYVG